MKPDLWSVAKAEAMLPGIVLGEYDQLCVGCGACYPVHVAKSQGTPESVCPHCSTENHA
jgi:hypothetical protein